MLPAAALAPVTVLVRAMMRLQQGLMVASRRVIPPKYALIDIVTAKWRGAALEAITRLGVVEAMAGGAEDVAALAAKLRVDGDALYRVLRALARDGLLAEESPRRFALTRLTRPLLAGDPGSVRNFVLSTGSHHNRTLWTRIEEGVRSGREVATSALGVPFWNYLAQHPDDAAEFDAAMVELTREAAPLIAASYDFGRFSTLVDLGGGRGELLATILARHPGPRGILLDLPHAVAGGPAVFSAHGVGDRCHALAGSLFDAIPAGHDAYILKNVLHNLDDAAVADLLRRCRAAISPQGRLFIVENVVPEGDGPYLQYLDLVMLLGSGGRERTRTEFAALLNGAGFALEDIIRNPTPLGLLVASPH